VYNIHAIKSADLENLAQQLAAEHEVERTTMLRALLSMVSLRERGWQEPSASSLSGTHAGMPDFTRLVLRMEETAQASYAVHQRIIEQN
jgi:hypothetical protein